MTMHYSRLSVCLILANITNKIQCQTAFQAEKKLQQQYNFSFGF